MQLKTYVVMTVSTRIRIGSKSELLCMHHKAITCDMRSVMRSVSTYSKFLYWDFEKKSCIFPANVLQHVAFYKEVIQLCHCQTCSCKYGKRLSLATLHVFIFE